MKTESMKKTLPKLTGLVLFLFLCLILPLNFWLQLNLLHQSQMESTKEIFWQTEQLIQTTEESLQEEEQEFKQSCIRAADMVAFHIESVIEKISDLDYIRELAKKVNVDEIHFFRRMERFLPEPIRNITDIHSIPVNRYIFSVRC